MPEIDSSERDCDKRLFLTALSLAALARLLNDIVVDLGLKLDQTWFK